MKAGVDLREPGLREPGLREPGVRVLTGPVRRPPPPRPPASVRSSDVPPSVVPSFAAPPAAVSPADTDADPSRYQPPAPPVQPVPPAEPRVANRADVEGLRGLAVLLVVGYHAALPWLPGGFVGVDVFFVVSGYVITSLLVAEVRGGARVNLWAFYARRCRRILPAAGFVLAATCLLGVAMLPPLARLDLARDVLAAALYTGNWHFIAAQTDYLHAGDAQSPVLHYWSLGVEEQFYLVWPFVFVAAIVAARRLRVARTTLLAGALTALTAGSFALSMHWTATSAPLAYLSSPSRGWQFCCGAWLALLLPVAARCRGVLARLTRLLLGVIGAAALGWACTRLGTDRYPGTAALVPTLATAALLAAGSDLPQTAGVGVSRLLSSRPMRRLGAVSFTWYLWHWPLIALVAARFGDAGWPVRLAVAVASLGPAVATTRWLERPLRHSAVVGSRPRVGLALGVAATGLPVCLALTLGTLTLHRLGGGSADGRVDREVVRFDDTRTSGPVTPSAVQARRDFPGSPPGCLAVEGAENNPACVVGRLSEVGPVVLFGDSHAEQWLPAAQAVAGSLGTGVLELTKAGCPVADVRALDDLGARSLAECAAWRENTFRRLEAGKRRPALVIVSSMSRYTGKTQVRAAAWARALDRLTALGAPVVYVVDTPKPDRDVPGCVSGALDDWSRCAFPRRDALWPDETAVAVAGGRLPGVRLVDLTALLCPPGSAGAHCPAVRGGVLLYRDDSHLSDTAVRALAPQFVAAVTAQLD